MKKRNIVLGAVVLGVGGLAFFAMMGDASASTGYGGDDAEGGNDGTPDGVWSGQGPMAGSDVTEVVKSKGRLPPGSVIISGPNLPGRAFAALWFLNREVDFGFMDRSELDKLVPEEGIEGNIGAAELTIVAINGDGSEASWYVSPPKTSEEMGEAVEELATFSGQI